jgi:hypothetical protein
MDTPSWLARCAGHLRRLMRRSRFPTDLSSAPETDPVRAGRDRASAARSLRTRLSARLRRDIGVDDG